MYKNDRKIISYLGIINSADVPSLIRDLPWFVVIHTPYIHARTKKDRFISIKTIDTLTLRSRRLFLDQTVERQVYSKGKIKIAGIAGWEFSTKTQHDPFALESAAILQATEGHKLPILERQRLEARPHFTQHDGNANENATWKYKFAGKFA